MSTVVDVLDLARPAYRALAELGEEVADEWQYVTDLSRVWLAELDRVAAERGAQPAPPASEAAVRWLVDEVGRIRDPHRAIDWLSTFPQAVLLALPPVAPTPGPGRSS